MNKHPQVKVVRVFPAEQAGCTRCKCEEEDFPGGLVVKDLLANAGHIGSTPVHEDPTCCRATKPV